MNVSVIIPAHDAAATLAATLESLQAQTFQAWEAIVVDDGSTDSTMFLAQQFAQRDDRIKAVNQAHLGVSAARNHGIQFARFDWLLFLDADDLIRTPMLERLTASIGPDCVTDAVCCGWRFTAPDGAVIGERYPPQQEQLFDELARYCVFAIHACIVRRKLVEAVGGFDTSLVTCEDWDLWQRVARTGARFVTVREPLASYRVRPGSAAQNAERLLRDGLRVIRQGHAGDPRVASPAPQYADGNPSEQLPSAERHFLCWSAGLLIGRNEPAVPLVNILKRDGATALNPALVASGVFEAACLSIGRGADGWVERWAELAPRAKDFFVALEEESRTVRLARCAATILERLIADRSVVGRPLTLGLTQCVRLEIAGPVLDCCPPSHVERLHCMVEFNGENIGVLELPVFDGFVSSYVLKDAIAAEFAWEILFKFYCQSIFRQLDVIEVENGSTVWRRGMLLADKLGEKDSTFWRRLFDRAGWTLFLQELWGQPSWPVGYFYNPELQSEAAALQEVKDGWLQVEVGQEIPDVQCHGNELKIVPLVGGFAIGVVALPAIQSIVRAQTIRAAITRDCGFELCRAAVRESLVGQSMMGPLALRVRLAACAPVRPRSIEILGRSINGALASGGSAATADKIVSGGRNVIMPRRLHGAIDTSVSRRAVLPRGVTTVLNAAADANGEPLAKLPESGQRIQNVFYAPEVIYKSVTGAMASKVNRSGEDFDRTVAEESNNRSIFEPLFAASPDPWKYTTPYEQTKYTHTLSLLPLGPIDRALELGCAEGHFTVQLASRVGQLTAADISQIALDRAAARCAHYDNVQFLRLDLVKDSLPGDCDLIVCSEVLYYVGDKVALAAVARKLTSALKPGGYLLTTHANLVIDAPDQPGFDWDHHFGAKVIGETFLTVGSLKLVKELRLPLYRVHLFQRLAVDEVMDSGRHGLPEIIESENQVLPEPEYASRILWQGGQPQQNPQAQHPIMTDFLPILAYHRVADSGPLGLACYRVSPASFEQQLRYLRDTGHYSIGLEDWRAAMGEHRPLPGRAVLITFDDGYLDFLTTAWPLLKHYGFSATVFLVADQVGRSNSWDAGYGEDLPLLGWYDVRRLRDQGVEFGSHSATHPRLSGLAPADIVREAADSRAILSQELGRPITAFAYPYGDEDPVVRHLIGACGYLFGLTCRMGRAGLWNPLLGLPRIEILGSDSFRDFVVKLTP